MAATTDNPKRNRYTKGGVTDTRAWRIDWWERTIIPTAVDDLTITVDTVTEARPDLIAHSVYGRANLMWLVLQYNNILDIASELYVGKTLRLPTIRRVGMNGW